MARDKKVLSEEVLGRKESGSPGTDVLITEVFYAKGGTSMFSGNNEPRGYWLAVRIETKHDDGTRGFMLFTGGVKAFLEPAARFSEKRLAEIVAPAEKIEAMKLKMRAEWEADRAKRASA